MRLRTRTWLMISVLSLMGAAIFWRLGEQRLSSRAGRPDASPPAPVPAAATSSVSRPAAAAPAAPDAFRPSVALPAGAALPTAPAPRAALRLSNSSRSAEALFRDERALVLRNALIDTASPNPLAVPEHLRAGEEPGSFIVQAAGTIDAAFRESLAAAGARTVSYLPVNAYLVEATAAQARTLASRPGIQAVVPFEPYFKLEPALLEPALRQDPLRPDQPLILTLLPSAGTGAAARDEVRAEIVQAGAVVAAEFPTPFGPALVVQPDGATLGALARVPAVQGIERHRPRQLANDLARRRIGVSGGTNAPLNFTNTLGLTGTNVVVNINDTGVDSTHPDLEGRVTADSASTLTDLEGHGTHVAATIAGNGSQSLTVSNAPGSTLPGADFRGMAPAARLYTLPIDLTTGPLISDPYLQQSAATNYYVTRARTNLLLSNNSWEYSGAYEYTIAAASFDSAVRDALPDREGPQPIAYVFSAGNSGFGEEDGQGGEPSTISAPGSGKNVITVGAIESPRNITNEVVYVDDLGQTVTNQVFLPRTDTDFQVASTSSRGNVEPGIEGKFGRFKPDVVAPGAFAISARSRDWTDPRSFSDSIVGRVVDQQIASGATRQYSLFVPEGAGEFRIRILPNSRSPNPFPNLPLYLKQGGAPTDRDLVSTNNGIRVPPDATLSPGVWNYAVGNLTPGTVHYDLLTVVSVTNSMGSYFDELKKLNDGVGPHYRFESGTSMAAPVVTGLLALFEEYFERQGKTPTPALLKALLINGARSLGSLYNFAVTDVNNLQGWGLVNLTNALPAADLDSPTGSVHAVQFADHTGRDALVTGQSRTWNLKVDPSVLDQIVKFTLVWTDPPGNPSAGIKLVNDLDIEVRNLDTGETYVGNDIPYRSDFNTPHPPDTGWTNDFVNNVENILIRPPLGTNYTVTVRARRVNVNAVTTHPDGIAQDFALAASVEIPGSTNALTFTRIEPDLAVNVPYIMTPTNGLALLTQRVGANSPLLGTPSGVTNQWTFFIFTNSQAYTPDNLGLTNGSNVAFITFLPPNLSRPRNQQADLDLYVSTDGRLTNLEPQTLAASFKSTKPGGTEVVFFTNAPLGEVYYIGVKAEDQQAGEFGFVALSSNLPFDEDDGLGNRIVRGLPPRLPIPDGSPDLPSAAYVFGIVTVPFPVQSVVVTNVLGFDSTGDILGNLSHNGAFSVLNNHALDPNGRGGIYTLVYDDSNSGSTSYGSLIGRPTDGPGKLTDFIGTDSAGPWILSLVDNAVTQTATNLGMSMLVSPQIVDDQFFFTTVEANSEDQYFIDVPGNATNLVVTLTGINPNLPLFVAVRRGATPTFSTYDKGATMSAPGGILTVGRFDVPPLNPGRWHVSVMNPNGAPVNYGISIRVELDLTTSSDRSFGLDTALPLADDARRTSVITVDDDYEIADFRVGLRVNHPRVSDLVFHLVSPQGTRLLLAENRGGPDGKAYGATVGVRRIYTTFTDRTNLTTLPIKYGAAPFTNSAQASVASNLVVYSDSFEQALPAFYGTGQSFPSGWTVTAGSAQVVQVPPGETNVADGIQYVAFAPGDASITTTVGLVPGRLYRLRYFTGRVAVDSPQGIMVYIDGQLRQELRSDALGAGWYRDSVLFSVQRANVQLQFRNSPNRIGLAIDGVTIEEADPPLNAYYLPEESLKPIIGQRSGGNWTLEVVDTRSGPLGGGFGDFDWRLEMIYALPAVDAVRLTNNVPYFGTVSGTDLRYFYVEVPRCATLASNILSGPLATLLLFGDQSGLPSGSLNQFRDDYGPYLNFEAGGRATFLLTTNTPPAAPLEPGQRYYLAVGNFQPDLTNNAFGIMVQFDCEDPPLPTVPILTNGVPTRGRIDPGPGLDYYQFTVSTNSIQADFELRPLNNTGNVDLYVRYGRVDDFPLPSPNQYDYKSEDPDPQATDLVSVQRTSDPIGLTPGVWYVAVRNADVVPVDYEIKVTETTTQLVVLTNGVAHLASIPAVDPAIGLQAADLQYYGFFVPADSERARFETFGADGDVNLYVRRGAPLATPFDYHFAGFNPGLADEVIDVANTNVPIWLSPGWWFLTVENADLTNVTYSIRATAFPASITPLINDVPVTNTVAAGGAAAYYSFNVSPNALSARFEVFGMTDDVQLLLRPGLPVPTFNDYTYASTNPGTAPESIELTPFSFPVGLTPGNWYLSVVNPGTNNATYTVKATEVTVNVIPLTNGVPYNASIPAGPGMDYYQFDVRSNAVAAEFKLTSAGTGNLDLYLHKGPPLPDAGNAHYAGITPGNGDELIRIETNSLPVPLSPGIWYLAVTNLEAVPVSYEISATEFVIEPPPVSGQITNVTFEGTNKVCITWVSIPGTNYFVVAKTNALDPAWTPVSLTIPAVDTSTTFCLEPLGPWRFFDVREGTVVLEPIPDPVPTLRLDGTNICVAWNSVVGTNYFVEAKKAVSDPAWTVLVPSYTAVSTNTEVCFPIDWGYRVFRVGVGERIPVEPAPLPPELVSIEAQVGTLCVSWPTQAGLNYLLQGKRLATDPNWTVISEPIPGTGQPVRVCLDAGTEFRFFEVIEGVSLPAAPPASVPVPNVSLSVDAAFQLCLTWDTLVGAEYFVEGKERLQDLVWTVISPILEAPGLELSYCQALASEWRYLRVRRVNATPAAPPEIELIQVDNAGVHLSWNGAAGARYQVFCSDSIPAVWRPIGGPVTSASTTYSYVDDGIASGAFGSYRWYRVQQLP